MRTLTEAVPWMPIAVPRESHAHDPRLRRVDAALRRHRHRSDALIEVLHVAQQAFGYLPREVLAEIASALAIPPSAVYGAATFYHFFSLEPPGRHTVTVCTGTACHVKRAGEIFDAIERATGVRKGGTTADGWLTLTEARCLGPCSQAPVVVFDGAVTGELDAPAVVARLTGWRDAP